MCWRDDAARRRDHRFSRTISTPSPCSPGFSEEQMTLKIGYEPIKGESEDDSCDHSDNDDTQDEEEFSNLEVYTEEMEAVEEHIEQCFGKFEKCVP